MHDNEIARHNLLAVALREAIKQSVRTEFSQEGTPVIFLSSVHLVAAFKKIWVYQDFQAEVVDYESCSGSFFFLMYKNLSVTSLWSMELLALLRTFSFYNNVPITDKPELAPISFYSDWEYTEFLQNLFDDTLMALLVDLRKELGVGANITKEEEGFAKKISDKLCPKTVEYFYNILSNTVIVNKYFTSCLVQIPQSRRINLKKIIAESGYIHSGGRAIYSRRASKAEPSELEPQLDIFLKGRCPGKKVYIIPYADELFTPYDRDSPVSLRNGLEEVKIRIGRYHISGAPLVDYLATLAKNKIFYSRVYLPQGIINYEDERLRAEGVEKKSSIWFIVDRPISEQQHSGRILPDEKETFLFVYEQAFINSNQFILFKERKPGWYASVTAPHTMTIALTNIMRGAPYAPQRASDAPKLIVDPFCGTGTMLFDAALRFPNSVVVGFDRSESAIAAVIDNAEFFSKDAETAMGLFETINAAARELKNNSWRTLCDLAELEVPTAQQPAKTKLCHVIKLIDEHILNLGSDKTKFFENVKATVDSGFPKEVLQKIVGGKADLGVRILFYSLWRAIALGSFAIRGEEENIPPVVIKELETVGEEIGFLHEILKGKYESETAELNDTNFVSNIGLFSESLFVSPVKMAELKKKMTVLNSLKDFQELGECRNLEPGIYLVKVEDSLPALQALEGKVDIVITDPPYGFNALTSAGGKEYLDLYGKLAPLLIGCLSDGGQLAIILAAFAKNGRQIPFYQTNKFIVRQIINYVKHQGRGLTEHVQTIPRPQDLFGKPYYWSSPKVLDRSIIHFRLSNNNN